MKVKCRNRSFDVFKRSEADALGMVYRSDWRNASHGDWILTADDIVLRVLGRRICKEGKNKKASYLIRTGYGETPTYKPQMYARKIADYECRRHCRISGRGTACKTKTGRVLMRKKPTLGGE